VINCLSLEVIKSPISRANLIRKKAENKAEGWENIEAKIWNIITFN